MKFGTNWTIWTEFSFCLVLVSMVRFGVGKSPTGGYAPGFVKCPKLSNNSFLREASGISDLEKEWLQQRQKVTIKALRDYLNRTELDDFDADEFLTSNSSKTDIKIALALSGGGYRAMLTGAGELAGLDSRSNATNDESLAGILQCSTYISALSGGAWLLGSLVMQDWPSVEEVVLEDPDDVWNLTATRQMVNTSLWASFAVPFFLRDLVTSLTIFNGWADSKQGKGILYDIEAKKSAGFNLSITDPWCRGLARQLFPAGDDNYGESTTFSDVRNMSSFANHEMPFPIINAVARSPPTKEASQNSSVVEFNPYEMGSFDPAINSFTDIKYLGTQVTNGKPTNGSCVEGFDNAGYIFSTSSTLAGTFINSMFCEDCYPFSSILNRLGRILTSRLVKSGNDVAKYDPNPFYGSEYSSSNITKNKTLNLVDGGSAGQVIPLATLMTKERALDAVFAFDNEAWPNGSSLSYTYQRQFTPQGSSQLCPYVPDEKNFLYQNLTAKPTFFGCNASNMTDLTKDGVAPPLLIYIANRPFEFMSNSSSFKFKYTDPEKKAMVKNGYDIVTRVNQTLDDEWSICVGCALIRREQERRGDSPTEQCQKCFDRYCWDGTLHNISDSWYRPVNFTMDGLTNSTMNVTTLPASNTESSFLSSLVNAIISK